MRALGVVVLVAVVGVSAGRQRPNLIIFQPDELRAESLGCHGHPVSKTPNFDAFAAQGTRFDQAHVSFTVCSQSRVAFMTGWPTHVAGHRSLFNLLHDWEPNMLKYFKAEGYTVKWWGKNDLLAHDAWNASVTSAKSMGGCLWGEPKYPFGEAGYYSFLFTPPACDIKASSDYRNVQAAIEFLKQQPADEPFVIFLPLTLPHPPYSVPEPFYSMYDLASLPPLRPFGLDGKPDYHAIQRNYTNLTSMDESLFRRIHSVYLGSIAFSDHLFGLLMDALDASHFANSTTVAVWSDHGDYAGDYGLVEKHPSGLEDVLTRVPLLVRTPGGAAGHVVREPVQLFDVVPTVLELAGIELQHVQFGRSLVPQLRGAAGDPERAVFAEGGYSSLEPRDLEGDPSQGPPRPPTDIYHYKERMQQEQPLSVARAASVRTLRHKLVFRGDPKAPDHCSELYDLQRDPRELVNLYNNTKYASVQASLKDKLFQWLFTTSDVTRWQVDPRNGGYPWPPPPSSAGGPQSPHDFMERSLGDGRQRHMDVVQYSI